MAFAWCGYVYPHHASFKTFQSLTRERPGFRRPSHADVSIACSAYKRVDDYSPGGSNRYRPITIMGAATYIAFFPKASFTP